MLLKSPLPFQYPVKIKLMVYVSKSQVREKVFKMVVFKIYKNFTIMCNMCNLKIYDTAAMDRQDMPVSFAPQAKKCGLVCATETGVSPPSSPPQNSSISQNLR